MQDHLCRKRAYILNAMYNDSRFAIYNYLYGLFYNVVTKNVYLVSEPQELTKADVEEGFIVLQVGNVVDESEFTREAYARVRCFVYAFIPTKSRGRVDDKKYGAFEESISAAVEAASKSGSGDYYIHEGSTLSADGANFTNADNVFYTYIKSFLVCIDK